MGSDVARSAPRPFLAKEPLPAVFRIAALMRDKVKGECNQTRLTFELKEAVSEQPIDKQTELTFGSRRCSYRTLYQDGRSQTGGRSLQYRWERTMC